MVGNGTDALQRLLLEAIANGSAGGTDQLPGVLKCTLACHQVVCPAPLLHLFILHPLKLLIIARVLVQLRLAFPGRRTAQLVCGCKFESMESQMSSCL